ncbi:MAG: beta-hydroxyacyl-ACP dehydratase [Rhodospirillaceae bacterium]|nr:beta-hydroxyacyl-ACP dehydratase [Rhodospirillaceae bacterium]
MRLERFELIDAVEELLAGERRIRCRAVVPQDSPVFEGHFPGYPLMPGVLLVEAMAQASGHLLLWLNRVARMPFLAEVRRARLRRFVAPATALGVSATLYHEGSGYAVTRAVISAGDQTVAEAELMFRLLPFPSEALRQAMAEHLEQRGLYEAVREADGRPPAG